MQDCHIKKVTGVLWNYYTETFLIIHGEKSAKCEKLDIFQKQPFASQMTKGNARLD